MSSPSFPDRFSTPVRLRFELQKGKGPEHPPTWVGGVAWMPDLTGDVYLLPVRLVLHGEVVGPEDGEDGIRRELAQGRGEDPAAADERAGTPPITCGVQCTTLQCNLFKMAFLCCNEFITLCYMCTTPRPSMATAKSSANARDSISFIWNKFICTATSRREFRAAAKRRVFRMPI